jgi:tRNA threonylcarbamoyladenosine biosynthesis protein TsaB
MKACHAMPCILAIETSANVGAVCVLRDGVATSEIARDEVKLSAWLLPAIDRALERAGVALADVDAFAYGQGPGSFTGVRTACATAQGLAYARAKPLYAVDSLHAFAYSALSSDARIIQANEAIHVIFDARINEAYSSVLSGLCADELAVIQATTLTSISALRLPTNARAVGNGALLIAKRDGLDAAALDAMHRQTDAAETGWGEAIARIAALRLARGEAPVDPRDAQPTYVRNNVAKTEAERAREATVV